MAKGQKKSNREAKKPKKSDAERLKAKAVLPNLQPASGKDRPKKT
jgi:hypothetical protein